MTLRVPNIKLDSTLKDIAKSIDYLDYRIIKADDVSLQILANDFTQKRATNNYSRITNDIENNRKKLNETTDAEEIVFSKQAQADNAKIACPCCVATTRRVVKLLPSRMRSTS